MSATNLRNGDLGIWGTFICSVLHPFWVLALGLLQTVAYNRNHKIIFLAFLLEAQCCNVHLDKCYAGIPGRESREASAYMGTSTWG